MTGAKLWSYTTGNYVQSSPAVINGMVYVGSFDGNVYPFGLQ
jgi:outer membrane protein assembly factor BamB